MHAGVSGHDGAETAGVQARFSETKTADVRDHVFLDRTVVTGGRDDGHHIAGAAAHIRTQSHGQADPSADDLPLLVYTAAVLGLRTGDHFQYQPFAVVRRQPVFPCQAAYLTQNMML